MSVIKHIVVCLFVLPVFSQIGSVALLSDYVCRGVSQSNGDPSLQANIDFKTAILNIKFEFASLSRENHDNEFVVNLGYTWEIQQVDITATYRYHYFQSPLNTFNEFDYQEFTLSTAFQGFELDLWIDEDRAGYAEGSYSRQWSLDWEFLVAFGYVDTNSTEYHLVNPRTNWRVEMAYTFKQIEIIAFISDTDNRTNLTGRRFVIGIRNQF